MGKMAKLSPGTAWVRFLLCRQRFGETLGRGAQGAVAVSWCIPYPSHSSYFWGCCGSGRAELKGSRVRACGDSRDVSPWELYLSLLEDKWGLHGCSWLRTWDGVDEEGKVPVGLESLCQPPKSLPWAPLWP